MAFVCPTITLTDTSALEERLALAKHYHVDTILSSSEKGNRHMGMIAGNDDSLVILRKLKAGEIAGDTRVIVLDRMPRDEVSAKVVCRLLQDMGRSEGALDNRIGEVFYWSREWIEAGLWCPTVLRKRELVEAALRYAGGMEGKLARLADQGASNDGGGGKASEYTTPGWRCESMGDEADVEQSVFKVQSGRLLRKHGKRIRT